MKKAFTVTREGDVFYIMQVCPDSLLSSAGNCAYALYCDCEHSDDGPLWQFRGYFTSEHEAKRRAAALHTQFESDCERHAGVLARRRERERKACSVGVDAEGVAVADVPF